MKRVLIISPHFPPVNFPDMQRVRMSLPYYRENGWTPVVLCVDEKYVDGYKEPLLTESVPAGTEVHRASAFPKSFTSKFGLGSLSIRSFFQIMKKGNRILRKGDIDLVFFSTTAFHVCRLGPYWKKKFGVPFVVDMQDPWRNDFYLGRPKKERPPKFLLSYNLDKWLEAKTIPFADGIISVSEGYCEMLKSRYPSLLPERFTVLPFCYSSDDLRIARLHGEAARKWKFDTGAFNIVYAGRGGHDLSFALRVLFSAFRRGLDKKPDIFGNVRFLFAGTSYAPPGKGAKTVMPVAGEFGLEDRITEITDRIPYFDVLDLLQSADLLVIPGSTDASYTASKVFPYLMAQKPLLAVFHSNSSVIRILRELNAGKVIAFENGIPYEQYRDDCLSALEDLIRSAGSYSVFNARLFEKYSAENNARDQCAFFERILGMKKL